MANGFTTGSVGKGILTYSLPLLGAYLLQIMYSSADTFFAGNFLGSQGIAAIGSISLVAICLVNLFAGLSLGANVMAAHSIGAKDYASIGIITSTSIRVSLVTGVVICVLGIACSPLFAVVMQVPANISQDAILYLRLYFIGLPAMLAYNMASGVLRGIGDSTTPLKAQIIGGLYNIALDALALVVFNLGVAGIALATVGCQSLACAYSIWKLCEWMRNNGITARARANAATLKEMLAIGIPAAIQGFALTLSNVFIQYVINGLGQDSIAAFVIYFQIEMLVYEPLVALGQTSTVFVAQNIGANQPARAKKGVRSCLGMGLISAVATTALIMTFCSFAFSLFTDELDVIELGTTAVFTTYPFYWLYAISEVCGGACRGMKHVKGPMATVLICYAAMRLVLLLGSPLPASGITGVALVYPITWCMAAVTLSVYYVYLAKKELANV